MAEAGSLISSFDCLKCLHIQLIQNQSGKQKQKKGGGGNSLLLSLPVIFFLMDIKALNERK